MSGTYAVDRSGVTGRLRDLLDNDVLVGHLPSDLV